MKLFWKLFFAAFVSFALVVGLVSYVVVVRELSQVEESIANKNSLIGGVLAKEIEKEFVEAQWPFTSLHELSEREDFLFWWVVTDDGTIYMADDITFMGTHAYSYFPYIDVSEGDLVYRNRSQNYGVSVTPFTAGGETWFFWIGFSLEAVSEAVTGIIFWILGVFLFALVLFAIILYGIISHFTKPICNLTASVTRVGKGDWTSRVEVQSRDELGVLAERFNQMTDDLQKISVSKDYLETILGSMMDALIVTDRGKLIIGVNRAACELLECEEEELSGRSLEALFAAEEEPAQLRELRSRNKDTSRTFEGVLKTKTGDSIPVLLGGSVVRDSKGFATHLVITAKDITERKKAEVALRESEGKYRNLVERANDGITILQDSLIVYANPRLAEMSGAPVEELIGTTFTDYIDHDELPKVVERYKRRMAGEDVEQVYETILRRRDGIKIYVELNAGAISYEGKLADLVIARDMTERKQVEEQLKDAYQELKDTHVQLVQAGKLAAMGEMAAGVAHEITQPLFGIKGFATALLEDVKRQQSNAECGMQIAELKSEIPPRAVNDLEVILQQTDRMTKIVNMVRDFARAAGTEKVLLCVNKPLEDALMLFSEQLRIHNIVVEENLARDLPQVIGNANQLQQVFINLITNARDAMDVKGGKGRLKIGTRKSTNGICIEIEDTGIGADAETVSRMFEPFFTTKTEGKGMGLGLSIVNRIIMEQGGRIDVQCAPGEGCKFSICLPFGVDEKEGETAKKRREGMT